MSPEETKNLTNAERDLMRDAILVQDACNLSGVVHSFSAAMTKLRAVYSTQGTDFFNRHPIAVLFASKIASLTGCEHMETFSRAYETAKRIAEQE